MYNVNISGLDATIKKIESYNKELADWIDAELTVTAENTALMARVKAPIGRSGHLASSISANVSVRFSKTVSVSAIYAPYVEFGTGSRVFKTGDFTFTPEMKAYAMEFFVTGRGKEFPQPYLFPALEINKKRFMARLKTKFFGNTLII